MALAGMIIKIVIRKKLILFRINLLKLTLLLKKVRKDAMEYRIIFIQSSLVGIKFHELICMINS